MKQPTPAQLEYWDSRLREYRLGMDRARNTNKLVYTSAPYRDAAQSVTMIDDHDAFLAEMDDDDFDEGIDNEADDDADVV